MLNYQRVSDAIITGFQRIIGTLNTSVMVNYTNVYNILWINWYPLYQCILNHLRSLWVLPATYQHTRIATGYPLPSITQLGDSDCKNDIPSNMAIWLVVDLPLWKILVNGKDYPIYYGKCLTPPTSYPSVNQHRCGKKIHGFHDLQMVAFIGLFAFVYRMGIWEQRQPPSRDCTDALHLLECSN